MNAGAQLSASWGRSLGWLRPRWVAVVLIALGVFTPATVTLIHNAETSPLDEWVFIDYTSKVFSQGIVLRGERVGQYTADLMACTGVVPGATFGECGTGEAIFAELPYAGRNGAADYTPTYFWLTALAALPFQLVGIDELTAWRLTGAIWLGAAMAMFYLLLRRWKVPDATILPLGLIVIGSPFVWWANSYVSTDAPAVFIGASLLYLATRIVAGDWSAWWLVIAAPIATAFKVTNLVGVGLAVVYLVGTWLVKQIRQRGQATRSRGWVAGLLAPFTAILAAAAVPLAWSRFLAATALPAPAVDQGVSVPLTLSELGLQATNFIGQTLSFNPLYGLGFDFAWSPLGWLSVTGVFGAAFMVKRWSPRAEVAVATAIAAVTMAPMFALGLYGLSGSYFQLSARYGASLIPAFMLSLGFVVRNTWARWLIGSYGALLILSGLAIAIRLNFVAA